MITTAQKRLLFEAFRRGTLFDAIEKSKPITQQWRGLGTTSTYRSVINAGLMKFYNGRTPACGCKGWLVLTQAGVEAMESFREEFQRQMDYLLTQTNYANSLSAKFFLAGAVVR